MGRITDNNEFEHIVDIITTARENAIRKVNEELITLYWNVGEYLSAQMENKNGVHLLLMKQQNI